MADSGFRLGIDFGTSNTVAVLRWPDGRTKSLLFDGNPLLPSAVYVDPQGAILSGRDAVHSARLEPHRFEPYPKRRVEEGTVWLAEREIGVVDLVATVLRRVATEAHRVAGAVPGAVTITHPAAWSSQRRDTLARAAVAAGLPAPLLVAEPVAAASYFVGTVGTHVPVGGYAVVYDFGAGTFDASVVRRNAGGGFEVLAGEGLSDAGGLDVDAVLVTHLGRAFAGRDGTEWQRLTNPETEADRRCAWQLWEDARLAKEMLSRAATTYVHVPLYDESVPVGREELEQLARVILDRTVTATQLAVSAAGLDAKQLAAIFLVGGSSRIPLAATLLHRAFGIAPTAIEQPELVVAEGALHLAPPTGRASVAPGNGAGAAPVSGAPISGSPISGSAPQPAPHQPAQYQAPQRPVGMPMAHAPVSPSPVSSPISPSPVASSQPGRSRMPAGYPTPPQEDGRRSPAVVGTIVAGALALVLTIAGVLWVTRDRDVTPDPNGNTLSKGAAPAVAAACGYKIAYLGLVTGDSAGDGVTVRDSTKFAIEQYNKKHPNCTVEFTEFDTQRKEDLGAQLARRVADDPKILGVVGPVYRSEVLAAVPVLNSEGVPMITPSAADADLSRKGWTVFHRLVATDADQAVAGARYLQKVANAKRTFIVADDSDYGVTAGTEVRRALRPTAVAGTANVKRADKDFAGTVKQVVDSGADAVYFGGFFDDGALFVKQLRAAKPGITIVAGDRVFTDSFVTGAGAGADGVVITCPCIPASQADRNFATDFELRYNESASYYGPEAYDATNVFLSGLEAGKSTRATMLAHVKAYDGRGVSRSISFTSTGDLGAKSLQIWAYKVNGGGITKDQVIPDE